MGLLLTLSLASIWLGVALVLASFNFWLMSAPLGRPQRRKPYSSACAEK